MSFYEPMLLDPERGGPTTEQWDAWGQEFHFEVEHVIEATVELTGVGVFSDTVKRLADVVGMILAHTPDATIEDVAKGFEVTGMDHCRSFAKTLRYHEKGIAMGDKFHRIMARRQPKTLSSVLRMQSILKTHPDREKRWLAFKKSLAQSRYSEELAKALEALAASKEAATNKPNCVRALGDAYLHDVTTSWKCYRKKRTYAPPV